MDDVDDILSNGRTAEEDMGDEDEDVEEDEEAEDQDVNTGANDDEEDEEDEEDGLEPKSGASEVGNQEDEVDDNEDDDDVDNEDEDEDETGSGTENTLNSDITGRKVEASVSKGQEVSQEAEQLDYDIKQKEGQPKTGESGKRNLGDEIQEESNDMFQSANGELHPQEQDVEMKDMSTTNTEKRSGPTEEQLSATSKLDKLHNYYTQMLRSAKIADTYNIYPTAAIPIQTDVNTLAMSKGLKYLFLGGSDGFIRKYDFLNTMDGKLALTILQKHSLAESIQNAGILLSYWENEIPQKRSEIKFLKNNKEYEPKVSPVHSLEVQSECLFLLSGLDNGGITLQGVRYMEGSIGHYFKGKKGHSNVVNLLKLSGSEDRFLSGSWDKRLLEWDLQNGSIINEYKGGTSEYSTIEWRPQYSSVNINDVSSILKNSSGHDQDDDDDMGSLFGDDEEEESVFKAEDTEHSSGNSSSISEEISKTSLNMVYDESVFMTAGLNGSVYVWDRRTTNSPVLNLERGPKIPPWCQSACWSMDGDHIYVGRRNAVVEEFDLKNPTQPNNTLKLPGISGPVSCVKAMPNNRHVLCASKDNIRIYDTKADFSKGSTIPFLIVPGHHGGSISNLYVDPTCRFLISTSGNRGWQGNSTDTTFIYEIDLE